MNTSDQNVPENSLFRDANSENPFPLFAKLRAMSPVIPIPNPMGGTGQTWMVTRIEEGMQVLKDHIRFTVDRSSIDGNSNSKKTLVDKVDPSAPPTFFTGNSMNFVDEPDHRRLRMLVSKAFTPKYMESLRPRVQEIADELIDRVQGQGEMDVVKDYAYPLPINVISEMLGVPQADRAQIHAWSESLARGLGVGVQEPWVAEHMRAFGEYTMQLVADKRKHPSNDLISQLIAIEEEGDRLREAELISMITLLIFAGHETTSNLIATGTLMLLDHPTQMEKLKADFSLVPSAVEELLRFNGPVTSPGPRFATRDVELAGQQIKKGDMVLVMLKSANRDEGKFTQPEELDITRKINRHLAFGHGIHMCLGAPLARVEADIAFTTLLRRMPNLRLSIPRESLTWHFKLNSQGLATLPITF
ncbi:cytochrome P450 [Bacillus inaquosorum]|uniref:cytochrome P450 family protein n=1 Tax=Bacillus inaquosorum TaxID=483913 RepID=UPI00227FACA3|nr:cytochrome P450 [Bacillus inaquosorum]MCY7939627.1 cytochrome P450 [Bacillus inaquosorum]MCY8252416.1 cytochrome P450 [Bacillus inaquosorum]